MTLFVVPFEDNSIKKALQKYWIIFDLFRPKLGVSGKLAFILGKIAIGVGWALSNRLHTNWKVIKQRVIINCLACRWKCPYSKSLWNRHNPKVMTVPDIFIKLKSENHNSLVNGKAEMSNKAIVWGAISFAYLVFWLFLNISILNVHVISFSWFI